MLCKAQNWCTKVHANKPMTIKAMKEIRHCISDIKPQLSKNVSKRTQISQQSRGEYLPDVLCHI